MEYFKVNNKDFSNIVSGLKVGYETLVSDESGRNAAGNTVIDVINRKVKLYVNFRHMFDDEMEDFLKAIEDYVVNITYQDPKQDRLMTITAYTGTPEPEYYTLQDDKTIYKPMSLNFIEL